MCISPIRIRHPTENKFLDVPCGRCPECLKKRRQDWVLRNSVEFENCSSAIFVTLTYDDKHLPIADCSGYMSLRKRDLQLFFKRLRKQIAPHEIRYFACGEYGSKGGRPHYHILLYNFPMSEYKIDDVINKAWSMSSIGAYFGTVTGASISYVCKYTLKQQGLHYKHRGIERPFMLCSRRPAIGANVKQSTFDRWIDDGCIHAENGVIKRLPRYYKEKYYSEYSRKFGELALHVKRTYDVERQQDAKVRRDSEQYRKQLDDATKRVGADMAPFLICKGYTDYVMQLIQDFEVIKSIDKTF